MYTGNPATNKIDETRLLVGDAYDDIEVLADDEYQYFLNKYSDNVNRASVDAARSILMKLSRWTRERTGDIEVYGSDWAKQYRSSLLEFIRNPNLSVSVAMPYMGGISKADMQANDQNADAVRPNVWIGMADDKHLYDDTGESDVFSS